ncbi:MAG: TmcC family electron transfer complex membrane anchor subunit [Thermodesulfobacteriota bacterium]
MHSIYDFITGPLLWISFGLFVGGSLYKLVRMIWLAYRKEAYIFSILSLKYSLRSILHWITPFATVNMRKQRVLTVVTFLFHICLFITPSFLLAHIVLLDESWNISWWALPDLIADIMTILTIAACLFFLVRRIQKPEVRYVTSSSDFGILAIVAAPFLTGFWSYHQLPGYTTAFLLHIISGELMLVAIPFTRLSHMLFSPFTRAYMGSEFGAYRHAKDW